MLVEFSLQNYRSFAEKQKISLVAGSGAKKRERYSFPTGNTIAPYLLRSACLFGPNGSGKTNLLRGMNFVSDFVISSAKDSTEGDPIDVDAFKLDKSLSGEPSEFELIFIHKGVLYQYGFSVDKERVWAEWLFSKPNAPKTRMREVFQRAYDAKKNTYEWKINDAQVKGEKSLWQSSTRDNALFLSTAVQLKSESLIEPFDWIRNYFQLVESPRRLSPGYTARQCVEENWKADVLEFLQAADIRIEDFEIAVEDFRPDDKFLEPFSRKIREKIKHEIGATKVFEVITHQKDRSGGSVSLDLDDESDGSQVIFNLAGPWLDVLNNGYTLVVDELHNSLHPHALEFLASMFSDPTINKMNAQLLFTSHDTSIMAKSFIHRDQIWLVEKDEDGASQLFPLSDFKVREAEAFQKAYLDGRYGAVPKIRSFVGGEK